MIASELPVVTFDLETTGVEVAHDRIIQIALVRTVNNASALPGFEDEPGFFKSYINPQRPIPPRVTELTGITDAMVADAPTFDQVAEQVHHFVTGSILVGFNHTNFDIPMLWEEFRRCEIEWDVNLAMAIDVGGMFKKLEPRTLAACVKKMLGHDHTDAHDAMEDVHATLECLIAMTKRYPELANLGAMELAQFSKMDELEGKPMERVDLAGLLVRGEDGIVRYTHKKVRGVPVLDDPGYATWMLRSDFSENTKQAIRKVLEEA